jgi:DNA-binding SARP family transcriptional activator
MTRHQEIPIRLRLLANLAEFRVGGTGLVGAGRRLALLAILAIRAEPVSRDELCELLWDPEPGTDTQHRFRELLSDTRRILPQGVLMTSGRLVSLSPGAVSCDVFDFRAAIAEGRVLDAARMFEAEFMTGCSPKGAGGFREWADQLGRQLNRELGAVRTKLIHSLRSQGDFEQATIWAERLWRDNPDDIAAAQLFVETSALTRDRAHALKASGMLDDHFTENRIEIPGELKAAIASAREIPEARFAVTDASTSHEHTALEGTQIATAGARKPALYHNRKWPTRMVVSGFIVSLFALLALVRVSRVQNRSAVRFGGGGTLALVLPDSTHSIAFTGSLPTDTQQVALTLVDSLSVWEWLYLASRHSVALRCPSAAASRGVCVRDVRTNRTIALPRIGTEDVPAGWSPDGSWLLVKSFVRAEGGTFQYDLFAINTASYEVSRLTNDLAQNDGSWSPDGSRIAVVSNRPNGDHLFIRTVDGRMLSDHSFADRIIVYWSPDARSLLVLTQVDKSPRITVIAGDSTHQVHVPMTSIRQVGWSPDSKYLALAGNLGDQRQVIVCEAVICIRPALTFAWPGTGAWVPERPPRYIHRVQVKPLVSGVRAGEVIKLEARAYDQDGLLYEHADIELNVSGTSDAWIDTAGFLHTVGAERLAVVANAGGWRADTMTLEILPAPPEPTRIDEDWENGLDSARWRMWGQPTPFITSGTSRALNTNGDDMYPSGVVSTKSFSTANGITLEWRQRTPLTGDLWQEVWIDFSTLPVDSFAITNREPYPVQGFQIRTPVLMYQPPEAVLVNSCGSHAGPFPQHLTDGRWHSFVFQLHPDHTCEFIIDGVRVDKGRSNLSRVKRHRLVLGGRTHKTQILLDDIRLSESPQWVVLPNNRAVRLNARSATTNR